MSHELKKNNKKIKCIFQMFVQFNKKQMHEIHFYM